MNRKDVIGDFCEQCGAILNSDAKFCPTCGTRVAVHNTVNCPRCGKTVPRARFCIECGSQLNTGMVQSYKFTNADGLVNTESLLKRVFMFLEDGEWERAESYCERVLDKDAENAFAYVGKLLAELKLHHLDDLMKCQSTFEENSNFQKAMRFGDESVQSKLRVCTEAFKIREQQRVREEKEQQGEIIARNGLVKELMRSFPKRKDCRNSYIMQIASLEEEKGRLGYFAGGRKKEIEEKLQLYYKKLDKYYEEENGAYKIPVIMQRALAAGGSYSKDEILTAIGTQIQAGELLEFGSWPQTTVKQQKPIVWIVLETQKNSIKLICKDCLHVGQFSSEITEWRDSDIRRWLNSEFFYAAFDPVLRGKIITAKITDGSGGSISDRIFILSGDEIERYFPAKEGRTAISSAAIMSDAEIDFQCKCRWWLRYGKKQQSENCNMHYNSDLSNDGWGAVVEKEGTINNDVSIMSKCAVRPVIWVRL